MKIFTLQVNLIEVLLIIMYILNILNQQVIKHNGTRIISCVSKK